MSVRTRFAPSPTGFLHIGGIRTALYNYLFAKQNKGAFILRLEDTDRARFVPEGLNQIVEGLNWVGLRPDEGFWISEGKYQDIDYVQSERHKSGLYKKYADELLGRDLAYYSYIDKKNYIRRKDHAIKIGRPFVYRKAMEGEYHNGKRVAPPGKYPIRLNMRSVKSYLVKQNTTWDGTISWDDEVYGAFADNPDQVEDFILIKSDGYPTYNFANVIDDHAMKITHVIRGDEFIASTGKHALLYDLFGWQRPKFIHLPSINGTDGKKLSKRTGDTNVLDYRDKGYLPEALINFLALLGWNPGTKQEIFSLDELIAKFKLEQINKSPAVFDLARLNWMNGYYIRQKPPDELYERVSGFWPEPAQAFPDEYKMKVLKLVHERLKYFSELPTLTKFFFEDLPIDLNLIDGNKYLGLLDRPKQKALLKTVMEQLSQSDFSVEDLTKTLNKLLKETGQKPAVLFSLIRIATTWAPASPGLADTLAVLGRQRTLQRLQQAIAALNSAA